LLFESSILENINMDSKCFEYINSIFNEISSILFFTDELIIYKNKLNENYFELQNNSQLIDIVNNDKVKKHSLISLQCTDPDIDLIYPHIYENTKKELLDKYVKNVKTKTIKDFCEARVAFSNQEEEKKLSLKDFILNIEKKTTKFLGYFENPMNFDFIEKLVIVLEDRLLKVSCAFDAEKENDIYRLMLENIYLLKNEIKDTQINDFISSLNLNDNRKNTNVDRMSAKKFINSKQVDKKFEKTIFSQVYRELKKWEKNEYMKLKNILLFKVNLRGENATDAGGPAREIFTLMFEDLMSKSLDLFIPTPNQQASSGLGRDLWTINPCANTIYHLDCFEFIGKVFAYSIISKVYCPINIPNFVWKLIMKNELQPEDLQEIDIVAYNSIVKPCIYPNLYPDELNALFDYATFSAALSNGEEIELIEGGKGITVDQNNYSKYLGLYLEARFREVKEQANAISKGMR